MLQYVLAGLALGSIYAIASASLTVTFVSAGVLNFAFGSMAYVIARFYYFLNSQHHWGTDTAGPFTLLVFAPLFGVALYFILFQFIRDKSTLIKMVATIGLSVGLPPVADLTMGTQSITTAPGLASINDQPYHFFGTPVTTDQLITYGFLIFIVLGGGALLQFTQVGLKVRAMVDSEALSGLSGVNPGRVSLGVWAVSSMVAGVAGILVAPSGGLTPFGMTGLMAAAFTTVVVARLRSVVGAVSASLAIGLTIEMIHKYLGTTSSFINGLTGSVPFGFLLVALVIQSTRRVGQAADEVAIGPLDQAIKPARQATATQTASQVFRGPLALIGLVPLAVIALLPLMFKSSGYWLGLVAVGVCYAITFLSLTIVTGEGGMLWLSQISFAGCGALVTGQIVTHWGWPVLPAILAAAVVSATAGAILGLLTVRLGDLYVALGTLSFGLLVETLVFQRPRFLQYGIGVTVSRPGFASGDMSFTYLALAVFGVFALLIINLRRSTTGMALRAVRDSQTAARTVGLSIVQMKVIVGAIGAFVAAVGGGFLAMYAGYAQPSSFPTFEGLIWLAVVVSLGIRSITAAAIAGLSFSLLPGIFSSYVPTRWAEVPALLFGLGAIGVARNPDGVIMQVVDGVTSRFSPQPPVIPPSVTPPPPPTPVDTDADPATQTQTQGDTGTISLREAKPAPKHRKVRS